MINVDTFISTFSCDALCSKPVSAAFTRKILKKWSVLFQIPTTSVTMKSLPVNLNNTIIDVPLPACKSPYILVSRGSNLFEKTSIVTTYNYWWKNFVTWCRSKLSIDEQFLSIPITHDAYLMVARLAINYCRLITCMDQKDYELRLNNSYISVNEDLGRAWFR